MRLRKDVNVYLFDPTRKYFHIVIELENVPGALRSVLEVMHGLNLNILGSFTSVDSAARLGVWSGFVEDSDHSAMDLKRRLGASPVVHDAMVVESNKGFLVDSLHFPVTFNTGTRAVMMGAKSLASMLSSVTERFGSGGNVILYEEGASYGRELGQEYLLRMGADFIMANFEDVVKLYQALGWFKVEGVKAGPNWEQVVVRVAESFECSGVESKVPHSHFVRGHLEGMLTSWLGSPMECKETLCIARGDKACEFVLTPRPA
ncbi:MAG: hypothetical protein JRN71_06870 [Nitrososphaerota archaeon]|nr:hypothetical protein [Nitrososphaerota archaeon]MDG6960626.1 hypothetical protein [Nitrososphaerota archaeon]MDG6987469.1 hypothetical protein [Nitrososphaerota archaeon]MDG7015009.1 hypothetical protein [Nitrososphaerota archaeon]WGO50964.1 MAG: hypothetical protein JRM93_02825 [Nitrososphaerota archaeon]